jgi:arsenite methyltransferase
MAELEFNEEMAAALERVYEIEDAVRRRRLVREALGAAPGDRILDVGCGPGFYCAELIDEVGAGGSAVGIDPSAAMLALAKRRCDGLGDIAFLEGAADALPVEDEGFDRAVCVQVLEYVEDIAAALGELHRALRPGGRVVVWDIDWATASLHADDPERNERVLRAWDEHLVHPCLPRTLAAALGAAGFADVRMTAQPFATNDHDPGRFFGPALIPFIGAFVRGRQGVTDEDADAWVAEQESLGERGEFYWSVTQFCFSAVKR